MHKPDTAAFLEGLQYAMETLAFVCVETAADDGGGASKVPDAALHCRIACRGAGSFRLNMIAPLALGHTLAGNMLGTDPDDPQASARAADVLREVMNVAGGTLCARLAEGSPVDMTLDLPESSPVPDPAQSWTAALATPGTLLADADGLPLLLWVEDAE